MPLFFAFLLAAFVPAFGADFHSHRYFLHEENGSFLVEEISYDHYGWPEVTGNHRFASERAAENFLHQHSQPQTISELSLNPEAGNPEAPALTGSANLWEVQNQWNWDWELRYADWVRANVRADFFVNNGISTDCADVAYALRWIFARINHLPMTSRLYTGEWFSEKSLHPDWQNLPTDPEWNKDQRFLAALRYALHLTYTHTLVDDAYPVAIRRESILEGGFQLFVHEHSGHTQPIVRVMREGETGIPIEILQSTLPRAVRNLMFDGYWNSEQPAKGKGGLLRFRWPLPGGKGLVKPEQMPYFSEEQFDPAFKEKEEPFFLAVFRRIWPSLKAEDIANNLLNDTRTTYLRRLEIVQQGFDYCQKNDCAPGSDGWENWSTPSRDQRAGQQLAQLNRLVGLLPESKRSAFEAPMKEPVFTLDGIPVTLDLLTWSWDNKVFSVDPRDPPSVRWAVSPYGLDGFFQKTIRTSWAKRNELLAATSDCPANLCVPGSEEWKKRYPVGLDFDLLRLSILVPAYCFRLPAACPEFTDRLERKFDLLGDFSLAETLRRFRYLNADPRHPADFRRTGAVNLFRTLSLPLYSSITASKNFLLAIDGEGAGNNTLWDLRGDPVKISPPHGKWDFLNRQAEEAYFVEGNTLGVMKLLTGETHAVSLGFNPTATQGEQPGHILARDSKHWAFLRLSPEGLRVDHAGEADKYRVLDAGHMLYEKDGKAFVASATAEPQEITLPKEVAGGSPISNGLGWFLNVNNSLYLILRQDYRVVTVSTAAVYAVFSESGRSVLTADADGHGYMLSLNERGETTAERKFLKVKAVTTGIVAEEGGTKTAYSVADGETKEIPFYSGEEELLAVSGENVVIKKGSENILRAIGNPTAKLKSSGHIRFLQGRAAEDGFVHICEKFDYSEENMRVYNGFCRIENFRHPELFSVFTGVSLSGYLYNSTENKIDRGFTFVQPSATIWAEYLGN